MSDGPLNTQQLQERLLDSPFNAFLDLEVVTADPAKQEVVMRLKMRPEFERLAGTRHWHGGPIAAAVRVRRSGKTVGVVDVDVLNEAGELVAIGRANYSTVTY